MGFTLIELTLAMAIGVYLCMLASVLLVGSQRSIKTIEKLSSLQAGMRSAIQLGVVAGIHGSTPSSQMSGERIATLHTPRSLMFSKSYSLDPASIYVGTISSSWSQVYGISEAVRVASFGAKRIGTGSDGPFNGQAVYPVVLKQQIQVSEGRQVMVMDPVQNKGTLQKLRVVNNVFTTNQILLKDDAGQPASLALLSSGDLSLPEQCMMGILWHLIVPSL